MQKTYFYLLITLPFSYPLAREMVCRPPCQNCLRPIFLVDLAKEFGQKLATLFESCWSQLQFKQSSIFTRWLFHILLKTRVYPLILYVKLFYRCNMKIK
jgi:hypothetical protein